eukprot:12410948-Prorocentrum_lima.AAC.1
MFVQTPIRPLQNAPPPTGTPRSARGHAHQHPHVPVPSMPRAPQLTPSLPARTPTPRRRVYILFNIKH